MTFKDKAYAVLGWFANLGGGKLAGYRTYISIAISFILKALVASNVLGASSTDAQHVSQSTDAVLLIGSGLADLAAVFYRAAATSPGGLAPAVEEAQVRKMIRDGQK